ncbi:hypothetical protein EDD11_001410, partial [Mortierella claussenii]
MGRLSSLPSGSAKRTGYAGFSKVFCDSIIFWGLYNGAKEETKGTATGKYIAELRDVFNQSSLDVESVKVVYGGRLELDGEYFTKSILKRHRRECDNGEYRASYLAVKVSLEDCKAKRVVAMLANALPIL